MKPDKIFIKYSEIEKLNNEIGRRRAEALAVIPGDLWAQSADFAWETYIVEYENGRIYEDHESGHPARDYYLVHDGKLSTLCTEAGIEFSPIEGEV